MKKVFLLALCGLLTIGYSWGQAKVTGTVTASDDGGPISFATIIVKGSSTTVVTDNDGKYSITVPSGSNMLVFSFMGYKSVEESISGRSVINIVLSPDATVLDETVVVGYGVQRKQDVTSSISKVSGGDIEGLVTPSFDQELAGRAAGVQVSSNSGLIGASPVVRIRGVNSLSSKTAPLYVIDGVPVTSGDASVLYAEANAMADINPADIESISILKDGAATAIFGSRASNGVILITTKKGKKGRSVVTYNGLAGISSAAKNYKLLNGREFTDIANELFANNNAEGLARYDGTDTDWLDYLYSNAFQQSHTISISGGTEKSQYYISGGYTKQDGIILANSMERYSIKADVNAEATKWLKTGISISTSNQFVEGQISGANSNSDATSAGIRMLPNVSVHNPDDPTGYNIDKTNRKSLGRGSNLRVIDNNIPNIVWVLNNNINTIESYRGIVSAFAEVKLYEGLTFKTLGGADIMLTDSYTGWHPASGDGLGYEGLLQRYFYPTKRWNWQNMLTYVLTINDDHNIDATLLQEYNKMSYKYFGAAGDHLSDAFFLPQLISGTFSMRGVYGNASSNGMASYMGRINYNYKGKYYIGASLRNDGLSKLPKNTRWGTFWGVSAAWRISNELFWQGMKDVVSDFRLRGSYALVGNQDIQGNFPAMGLYSPIRYGSDLALYFSNVGNRDLKWEQQKSLDLGFDMQLLNGRFTIEFAYWQKNNDGIVLDMPMDPMLGLPGDKITKNIGQINNSGIELSIGGKILTAGKLSWSADVNFSTQKNKVMKLVDEVAGKYTIVREGVSMNSIWGYKFYDVNKTNGNPMWYNKDGDIVQYSVDNNKMYYYDAANPGDLKKTAANLSDDDKVILGSSLPKWFGGVNTTLTYDNFDLNLFFNFAGGNKIMNVNRQDNLLNLGFMNKGREILDRWQSPDKAGNGLIPKIRLGYDNQTLKSNEADSRFVETGSYLKLGNVTLGYTLPKKYAEKIGLSNVRVYTTIQNVFTITGYSGIDPEIISDLSTTTSFTDKFGVDAYARAIPRTFILGLNFTF